MVRNVKQARNGDILIASYLGVFRYDGKSFTNITSEIQLADLLGCAGRSKRKSLVRFPGFGCLLPFTAPEPMGNPCPPDRQAFSILQQRMDLPVIQHCIFMKIEPVIFGSGASRYDGKSFRNFTTKDGFPSNSIRLLLEDKTGKLWFGAQGEDMFVYDAVTINREKHLPF